jgi:hypothetical protein
MPRIQIRRGTRATRPNSGLLAGEQLHTTDTQALYIATGATTSVPVLTPIDELTAMGAVDGAADLVEMWDTSAANPKNRKITFDAFKTALNIPVGSSDELVAVVAGGTAGYIWGTTGNDGILRVNGSMVQTKDAGNAFVTLGVGDIDLGTW